MTMDSYTHSSYTLIQATDLIRQGVKHVLAQGDGKVPEDLRKDLTEWQVLGGANVGIPFELVRKVHRQLLETPISEGVTLYLHELMKGSEIILPTLKPLERNPKLVARLNRIKAQVEQREYNKMVGNVDASLPDTVDVNLAFELRTATREVSFMVNLLLTIVGCFVFGFFASYYAGFSVITCTFVGLLFGMVAFFADLYFLLKFESMDQFPTLKDKKKKN
ncbi:hypothetical protein EMCRGX_G024048 [Ephydatia muelleri]|eukprot:Em0015g291a